MTIIVVVVGIQIFYLRVKAQYQATPLSFPSTFKLKVLFINNKNELSDQA